MQDAVCRKFEVQKLCKLCENAVQILFVCFMDAVDHIPEPLSVKILRSMKGIIAGLSNYSQGIEILKL